MSKTVCAVAMNSVTILIALFLSLLVCVGIGMAAGDSASVGMKIDPEMLESPMRVFAETTGLFVLSTTPSWLFIRMRKPGIALATSTIPFALALSILLLFRRVFS